jgi:hypothetical protein
MLSCEKAHESALYESLHTRNMSDDISLITCCPYCPIDGGKLVIGAKSASRWKDPEEEGFLVCMGILGRARRACTDVLIAVSSVQVICNCQGGSKATTLAGKRDGRDIGWKHSSFASPRPRLCRGREG